MKVFLFSLYLFFQLLYFGNYTYGNTLDVIASRDSKKISQNSITKFISEDQNIIMIDDADFDLEEELQSVDNNNFNNKLLLKKQNLINSWFSTDVHFSVLNYHNKFFKTLAIFIGYSCPFYFSQRVLKI
jgi:hypothetical protein